MQGWADCFLLFLGPQPPYTFSLSLVTPLGPRDWVPANEMKKGSSASGPGPSKSPVRYARGFFPPSRWSPRTGDT